MRSTFFFVWHRARRAAKEAKEAPAQPAPAKVKVEVKKFVKIGRPGYKGNLKVYSKTLQQSWVHINRSVKSVV